MQGWIFINRASIFRIALIWIALFGTTGVRAEILPKAVPEPQKRVTWCWIATDKEILSSLNINKDQCSLAKKRIGLDNCCAGNDCHYWGYPDPNQHANVNYSFVHSYLNQDQIFDAIYTKKKAFGFSWWIYGNNHYMVGVGQDYYGEVLYYHSNVDNNLWGTWWHGYVTYNHSQNPAASLNVKAN
jgi:hypothetical protein